MSNTVFYFEKVRNDPVLYIFDSNGNMKKYALQETTTIGRNTVNRCVDIALSSCIVSRQHGMFERIGDHCIYTDCNSTNGTYVNGVLIGRKSISQTSKVTLKDGDILSFDLIENGHSHQERVVAVFSTSLSPDTKWKKIQLGEEIAEINIGRTASNALNIENEMISEHHASFFRLDRGWAIADHSSTNGVYVNASRIRSSVYLNMMDVIRIATICFVFYNDFILFCEESKTSTETKNTKQLKVNILERSVMQRFKKIRLLQDINLTISSGEMVLILGGSGAGKTTFINAVMGYEKADGHITYDQTDIYQEYERMKYKIGFVPQQDLLRGSDSVYDTLSNAAMMKLPASYTPEERENRISTVLEDLGLSRERNTMVTKLSGGQRKRLSIAVEFIAEPALFFLDEPDSGLDDIMGRGLMENLRKIADKGTIIMVITHSPQRAATLFDKVLVLAKSTIDNCGHLAFYGSPKEAYEFFDVQSFDGIVKKINRKDENGEGLSDFYIDKYKNIHP
ncbi:MAG: ATP-binding cassette domain-containing protein [Clostridia bacterium]|nr:ATP-binding cassette domain-containing protein [Clostridia bacterium]